MRFNDAESGVYWTASAQDSQICYTCPVKMHAESSMGKVVVRTCDGKVYPGFSRKEDVGDDKVKIITRDGKEKFFATDELKGLFFVKDFKGDPEYDPVKFLNRNSVKASVWVHVEFEDGEVIEGMVRDHMSLLFSSGFYLWPSDEDNNNGLIYIVKKAIRDFEILSAE